MSGFVKGQIDQMEKRFAGVVGFQRRHDEDPSPPQQPQEDNQPSVERPGVGRRIGLDQPLFGRHPPGRF